MSTNHSMVAQKLVKTRRNSKCSSLSVSSRSILIDYNWSIQAVTCWLLIIITYNDRKSTLPYKICFVFIMKWFPQKSFEFPLTQLLYNFWQCNEDGVWKSFPCWSIVLPVNSCTQVLPLSFRLNNRPFFHSLDQAVTKLILIYYCYLK